MTATMPTRNTAMVNLRNARSAAHAQLRASIEQAESDLRNDIRILVSATAVGGDHLESALYKGTWVDTPGGLKMMLIDDNKTCPPHPFMDPTIEGETFHTRALCSGSGKVPAHTHTFREYIQVIQGYLVEHTTGRQYIVGEHVHYAAGELHEPELQGLAMICWHPPLPRILSLEPVVPVL